MSDIPPIRPPVLKRPLFLAAVFEPREAIRYLLLTNPRLHVWKLAAASAAINYIVKNLGVTVSQWSLGKIGLTVLLGGGSMAMIAIPMLYLGAWINVLVADWLGGRGSTVDVRAAFAWSGALLILSAGLWPAYLLVAVVSEPVAKGLSMVAGTVFSVWSMMIICRMLSEVHGFSARRAFASLILSGLIVIVPLWLATAIPNIFRGRTGANERIAIEHFGNVRAALQSYQSQYNSYPDRWISLYDRGRRFVPEPLRADLNAGLEVQGYRWRYRPLPEGCQEPSCSAFELTAVPVEFPATGTVSFRADPSSLRYCAGPQGASETDVWVPGTPKPCAAQ